MVAFTEREQPRSDPVQNASTAQAPVDSQATTTETEIAAPPLDTSRGVTADIAGEAQSEDPPLQFREPAPFIASKLYNPESLTLNEAQLATLNSLLREINSSDSDIKSKLHGAAARRVPDMLANGYAHVDPGNGQVERIGPKQLRVFFHSNGLQYYFDVDRNQFAELDTIIAERDQLLATGATLVKEFFTTLPKREK